MEIKLYEMVVVAVITIVLMILVIEGLYRNSIKHLENIEWRINVPK